MGEKLATKAGGVKSVEKMSIPYIIVRVILVVFALLMFFPGVSPTRIVLSAGQSKVSAVSSLFTNSISYASLTNGLTRAFQKGWLNETYYYVLFAFCVLTLIGLIVAAIGGCMSVGNLRMKNSGNRFLLIGSIILLVSTSGILLSYFLITGSANPDRVTFQLPLGVWIFLGMAVVYFVCALLVCIATPKADKEMKMEMEPKFQLFLMLMPFLALVLAFSYLPLFSWRYAFFDYTAGSTLSWDNFVGLKWFKLLVQNSAYITRLGNVLKNTLVMSGLGILTSWVPMAFAILLTEARSARFKRFVQTFTTIPNFISWVLVYAIAFAIFNTDGFINTFLNNITGVTHNVNYLNDESYSWLKMLLWGMWKGTGWSAIIYISGISGIDQQLYEAATVDGASRFQKMWHITVPGLLPTYVVMLIMSIAGILSNGMDQYLVFTNANNKNLLEVLDLYVYNLGIGDGQIPLSTVVGMTKSIISVALLFVANTVSKWIRGTSVV